MIGKIKVVLSYCGDLKHEIQSIDYSEFVEDLKTLSRVIKFDKIEIFPL